MELKYIKNWYVPPVVGLQVALNPEGVDFQQYNDRQAKETTGIIKDVNITSSGLMKWQPERFESDYVISVEWKSGHTNDYTLADLMPIYDRPQEETEVPKVKMSDGSFIVQDEHFLKNIAIAVIEKRLCRVPVEESYTLNVAKLLTLISKNITYVENLIINNEQQAYHVDMLNTLYDTKGFYEKTNRPTGEEQQMFDTNPSVELMF